MFVCAFLLITDSGQVAAAAKKTAARESLDVIDAHAAWREPGFRFDLAFGGGRFFGIDGAPSGYLVGLSVRPGVRLDDSWSLYASFQYQLATSSGELLGLRYSGTLEPTWHAWRGLSVAVGVGFGGIVEGRTERDDVEPLPETLDTSYTFPDASTPINRCSGVGVAALARADYLFVLGPRASTGPVVELVAQWTGCVQDTRRDEPDTARPIERRQWWPHLGLAFSWTMSWR